jgi:hypothetical protein
MAYNNFEDHSWKKIRFVFFFQTSTCIQINKEKKVKKNHFTFIVQKYNIKKLEINKNK